MEQEFTPTSLNDIYDNTPSETENPQPVQAPEPEQSDPVVNDENVQGVKENESEPPSTQSENEEPTTPQEDVKTVPLAALTDERNKRQELERQLEDLNRKLSETEPKEEADFFLDPEGAMQQRQDEMEDQLWQTKANMSAAMMMQSHPDYREVEAVFLEAVKNDHVLGAQMQQHPHPAQFAYEKGKQLQLMQRIGNDPEGYEKRIAEEAVNKFKAELEKSGEKDQLNKTLEAQPSSLAGVPNAGSRRDADSWNGPTPIDDIYND